MELHDAIIKVLEKERRKMTANEIASKINSLKLYSRGDSMPLKGGQITARINRPTYSYLFTKDKSVSPMLIGLK
jgi:hypothetical protein